MANQVLLLFGALLVATAAVDSARTRFRPRIVGGIPIDITEAPFQISLMIDNRHACGGSILSADWILTAAHCIDGISQEQLSVRAGSTLKDRGGQIRELSEAIMHPDWDDDSNDSDIALLKLEAPLVLDGERVASIELEEADAPDPDEGTFATVTGWGATMNYLHSNRVLRSTEVPIVSRRNCGLAYQRTGPITERMICAGFYLGGHDSCQGDSGGPLVLNGLQVGVVSWANGCAQKGYPGVNARVASVRDWIREESGI
uniref:trypsin n=1 Tax=Anopheles atroparvus TaxID=41427 RepID=A0AAG5D7P5_ANOAO